MFEGIKARRTTTRLMGGTAVVALPAQASSAQSWMGTSGLEIPAKPLEAALNDVGLATDSRVMFSKDLVPGHIGPRLSGNAEPARPVSRLSYRETNAKRAAARGPLAVSGIAALTFASLFHAGPAFAQMTVTPTGSVQVNADTTTTATTNTDGMNASSSDESQLWNNGTPISASTDGTHSVSGDGLALVETGSPAASISVVNNAGSSISSSSGIGLDLSGNGGSVSYSGGGTVFGNSGLTASEMGSGAVTLTVGSGGSVFGLAGDGIESSAVNGDTLVTIDGGFVSGSTGFSGVDSSANGSGNLTVTITPNFGFVAGDTGVSLTQTGTGSNSITNGGTIIGLGTAANPVIAIATTNAGTTTITNNAGGDISAPNDAGLAILSTVTTGADHIVNAGSLTGQIYLSNQSNSLANSGTWYVSDNSVSGFDAATFGTSGLNTLTNSAGGVINAGLSSANSTFTGIETINNAGTINAGLFGPGATTFIAGGAFAQTVTNTGVINVRGTLNFEGDATFNNTGGLIDMRNGVTADVTALNVTVGSGASSNSYGPGVAYDFIGSATSVPTSRLGLDSNLGGVSSTGSNVPSDRLLIGGTATGTTGILIHDTGTTGAFNPTGITLVAVNGASTDAFNLQGVTGTASDDILQTSRGPMGAIKKGYFFYPLLQTTHATAVADGLSGANSTEYRLYGLPDVEAFQTPLAVTGAENIWYDTALGWSERQDELRKHWPAVYGTTDTEAEGKFSLWMHATGNWDNRSSSNSVNPFTPVPGVLPNIDTSFAQATYSLQIGTDVGFNDVLDRDSVLVIGSSLGLVSSAFGFNASANKFDYSGVALAVTADYLDDGWFWDTLLKADLLEAKLDYNSLTFFGLDHQSVEADTYGVLSSAGYHLDLGSSQTAPFLEPLLTVAYTSSTLGSYTAFGTTANFNASPTVRGALGARLGDSVFADTDMSVDASITGNYWNEFTNNTSATLVTGPPAPALTLRDVREKGYGEVSGEVGLSDGGWLGFLDGGAKFNSQFTSVELKAGLTYKW